MLEFNRKYEIATIIALNLINNTFSFKGNYGIQSVFIRLGIDESVEGLLEDLSDAGLIKDAIEEPQTYEITTKGRQFIKNKPLSDHTDFIERYLKNTKILTLFMV